MYTESMEAEGRAPKPPARGAPRGWSASHLLSVLGGLLLLGAAAYAAHTILHAWLLAQDRYLVSQATAQLAVRDVGPTSEQLSSPQSEGVGAPAVGGAQDIGEAGSNRDTTPVAVRIRIPAIGVNRAIIDLPLTYDSRTGTWERDYDLLFRRAGEDLVGHWDGSALPGQPGNVILVGHNYGYGYSAVFVRLGHLQVGQRVEVVNAAGQVYAYRVTEVKSIRWKAQNEQELLQHLPYLTVQGPERLTLVTCGGSSWAPYPNRVYVVAEPEP